ncbi:MAG: copper resistance protein CopC [Methylococcales bacterium]|nr:copper resistance protein CopC [Methylococcales bacterium]
MKKVLVLLLTVGITWSQWVSAHAIMVRSTPTKEESTNIIPSKVDVWFDAGVGPKYTSLAVVNSKGERVDNGDGELEMMDKSHLSATLKPITPGRYGVRYRVQSEDGHIVTGKFFFEITK